MPRRDEGDLIDGLLLSTDIHAAIQDTSLREEASAPPVALTSQQQQPLRGLWSSSASPSGNHVGWFGGSRIPFDSHSPPPGALGNGSTRAQSTAMQHLARFARHFVLPDGESVLRRFVEDAHKKGSTSNAASIAEQLLAIASGSGNNEAESINAKSFDDVASPQSVPFSPKSASSPISSTFDWQQCATHLLTSLCELALHDVSTVSWPPDQSTPAMSPAGHHRISHQLPPMPSTRMPPRTSLSALPPRAATQRHNSVVSLADSGILRRVSTTFFNRAVVGDEEDDGTFTINQHVVLMQLGRGAQGEVFLAMDTVCNELRAIKAIRRPASIGGGVSGDSSPRTALEAAKRHKRLQLEREIAIMKRCRHRNIVTLHEVIDDPTIDVMYLVMQYVEKGPIAHMTRDGNVSTTVPPPQLADYTIQVCKGLRYLHRIGIVHRDIKPDNLLLGGKGDVYLADFGMSELFVAARGGPGVMGTRGTIAFMAPELFNHIASKRGVIAAGAMDLESHDWQADEVAQAASVNSAIGNKPVPRSGEAIDVFALGVTLHLLLLGRLPWRSTTLAEMVDEISNLSEPPQITMSSSPPTLPRRSYESEADATDPQSSGSPKLPMHRNSTQAAFRPCHDDDDDANDNAVDAEKSLRDPAEESVLVATQAASASKDGAASNDAFTITSPLHGQRPPSDRLGVAIAFDRRSSGPELDTAPTSPKSPSCGFDGTLVPGQSSDSTVPFAGAGPWLDLIRGMLHPDPAMRLSISVVLERAQALRVLTPESASLFNPLHLHPSPPHHSPPSDDTGAAIVPRRHAVHVAAEYRAEETNDVVNAADARPQPEHV